MAIDFTNVSKLKVTKDIRKEYRLGVALKANAPSPSFTVVSAGEANKVYFNAFLKSTKSKFRQISNQNMSADLLAEIRDNDRDLYSKYIIVDWKNVYDGNGNPVEFNPTNVKEFLTALPNQIFDEIRQFCGNYVNFMDEDFEIVNDMEEIAKNS